jgi:protein-S-isoprenylcysteine O-methyltransferase Ste14
MILDTPTLATAALVGVGTLIALPVLIKGFGRAGKGVFYERHFWLQRAPQFASLLTIFLLVAAFLTKNNIWFAGQPAVQAIWTLEGITPDAVALIISWLGVIILASGLIFMIGGWYSLGDMFSTDAEILDNHTVCKTGMLKFVMHPIYSGIVQSLFGAAVAAQSWSIALFTLLVVAPLWLRRAKYEEELLLKTLGPDYKQYAEELKWRRLVPPAIPFGF